MSESWPVPPTVDLPRYSRRSWPPYSYVSGRAPHPVNDPRGHLYREASQGGAEDSAGSAGLDPSDWHRCEAWLWGIDLFNHGYYWEAHEAWEALWLEAGRRGAVADFLKGLIKLAAAGVKAREGNPRGVCRHAERAAQLLARVRAVVNGSPGSEDARRHRGEYCGLELARAITSAEALATASGRYLEAAPVQLVPCVLILTIPP